MSEMPGFDAAADWRSQKSADEAEFTAQLTEMNPHTVDMGLPDALREDGGR